jgi:hypothetical protein
MRITRNALIVCTAALALGGVSRASEGTLSIEDYLAAFPSRSSAADCGPQTYRLEYDLHNRGVTGVTQNKIHITGTYTRRLEDGRMRWSDVEIAGAAGPDAETPPGAPLAEMEGFEYGLGLEIVQEPLYERFTDENIRQLAKTMVWDGAMVEAFDLLLASFAGLRPNEFARVEEFEDFDVQMGDWGSIKMRGLRVKWSGVSVMHGEPCVVVLYQSFSNPVDAGHVKGRSCYWGQFWLSRDDGEIECLTLNEDVILDMPTGAGSSTLLNMQREVRFEKVS